MTIRAEQTSYVKENGMKYLTSLRGGEEEQRTNGTNSGIRHKYPGKALDLIF